MAKRKFFPCHWVERSQTGSRAYFTSPGWMFTRLPVVTQVEYPRTVSRRAFSVLEAQRSRARLLLSSRDTSYLSARKPGR